MGKKLKPIPRFASWEEEDEFWATHSLTDLDLEQDPTPLIIRKKLPFIGRRKKIEVECLFDTGASSSFIHPELVRSLGLSTADPTTVRIRLGKGSTQVSRIAAVTIRLNGVILADSPYVMPGLTEDYVLGAGFLERYDIRLDPKRHRLLLPPKRRLSLILV